MNRFIHYIAIIILSLASTCAYAEEQTTISCINISADTIIFNNADWSPLFDRLQMLCDSVSTEREVVSIVHLGDSHIQAGHFTEALRVPAQQKWGNAGRGLITPLKLTKTNEPRDYSITSPDKWSHNRCLGKQFSQEVGVGGISIQPISKYIDLTISTTSCNGEDERFCSLRLLHSTSDKFPQLLPTPDLDSMQVDYKQGETHYQWSPSVATNTIQLQGANSYEAHDAAIYGALLENGKNGVLIHSIGNNSATYECYNKVYQYGTKLAVLQPHLVIISMGTNESVSSTIKSEHLYNQIDLLISSIKQESPDALILLTTPADNKLCKRKRRNKKRVVYYAHNPHITTVVETIKQYGKENNIAVWDWFTISGGENTSDTWVKEQGMAKDHIHYTQTGYSIQGNLLFESIYNAYEQHIRQHRSI